MGLLEEQVRVSARQRRQQDLENVKRLRREADDILEAAKRRAFISQIMSAVAIGGFILTGIGDYAAWRSIPHPEASLYASCSQRTLQELLDHEPGIAAVADVNWDYSDPQEVKQSMLLERRVEEASQPRPAIICQIHNGGDKDQGQVSFHATAAALAANRPERDIMIVFPSIGRGQTVYFAVTDVWALHQPQPPMMTVTFPNVLADKTPIDFGMSQAMLLEFRKPTGGY